MYLWVEAVREFLQNKADSEPESQASQVVPVVSTEDDDFPEDLEYVIEALGEIEAFHRGACGTTSVPCPEIVHGGTLTDRRSTFQPHLARVKDKAEVSQ